MNVFLSGKDKTDCALKKKEEGGMKVSERKKLSLKKEEGSLWKKSN